MVSVNGRPENHKYPLTALLGFSLSSKSSSISPRLVSSPDTVKSNIKPLSNTFKAYHLTKEHHSKITLSCPVLRSAIHAPLHNFDSEVSRDYDRHHAFSPTRTKSTIIPSMPRPSTEPSPSTAAQMIMGSTSFPNAEVLRASYSHHTPSQSSSSFDCQTLRSSLDQPPQAKRPLVWKPCCRTATGDPIRITSVLISTQL